MTSNVIKRHLKVLLSLLLLTVMALGSASAEVVNLCTGQTTITMEDGTPITVWGFGDDPTQMDPCIPTVPGPLLRTDPADIDTVLTINLRNTLAEPVSYGIPTSRRDPGPSMLHNARRCPS